MKTFEEYIKLLERVDDLTSQVDNNEEDANEPEDFVKLKRFLFLALSKSNHQLLPLFQQIAASDHSSDMADLLHNIDWQGLKEFAKETLKKWDGRVNQSDIEDEEDDDTKPVKNSSRSLDSMDRVKLPSSDAGQSDQDQGMGQD